ncbi:toxin, partial [Vibrio anguillarum]|nr:toxin [Vibrio anguillarum]
NTSTPVIPKGKDPNLINKKIPLDAFLLYKSTATGIARGAGALNLLLYNPKVFLSLLLGLICVGWFIYGLSGLVFGSSSEIQDAQANSTQSSVSQSSSVSNKADSSSNSTVSDGGN